MPTITLIDASTLSGQQTHSLVVPDEPLTARRLLHHRIYEEVAEYNARADGVFQDLVQPTEAEQTLNGFKIPQGKHLDWEEQYRRACLAFVQHGFLLLVNDRQVTDLDAPIAVESATEGTFFKLVLLVGV